MNMDKISEIKGLTKPVSLRLRIWGWLGMPSALHMVEQLELNQALLEVATTQQETIGKLLLRMDKIESYCGISLSETEMEVAYQ